MEVIISRVGSPGLHHTSTRSSSSSSNSTFSPGRRSSRGLEESSSSSTRRTSVKVDSHFPERLLDMANHQSAFQAWQDRFHRQRLEESEEQSVQDSLEPFSQQLEYVQPLSQFSQQPRHFTSEEEFMRLLNEPPFQTQKLNAHLPSPQGAQFFSCPTGLNLGRFPNSAPTGEVGQVGAPEDEEPVSAKKKRGAPKKTTGSRAKKNKKVVELSDDDEDGEEGNGATRWTDPEVQQLIALRGEMDEEFDRNAKKQGVSTWDKLQGKMITACDNFSKTAEACRKKWKVIYRQYSNDKRLLQISGEGRKISCRFFKDIDQCFNNRANVRKLTHGDASGTPNPCPPDLNEETQVGQGADSGGLASTGDAGGKVNWHYVGYYKIVRVNWDDTPFLESDLPTPTRLYYPPSYGYDAELP